MNLKTVLAGGVGVVAVVCGPAAASEFYGVTTGGALRRFDMTAMTVTHVSNLQIGPTLLNHSFVELTSDSSGTLYGIRSYSEGGGFPPAQVNEFIRIINPALGTSVLSSNFGPGFLANVHNGVAHDTGNNYFTVTNSNGHFGRVDVTTGAFTAVSGVAHGSPWYTHAMAVNPVDGEMYTLVDRGVAIFGQADFTLLRMDIATGLTTTIGSLGLGPTAFMQGGLRFDESGTAYTVNPADGNVYTVNLTTGAASFLFAGGPNAVGTTGLALIIPAPGSAALAAMGLVFAARRRR